MGVVVMFIISYSIPSSDIARMNTHACSFLDKIIIMTCLPTLKHSVYFGKFLTSEIKFLTARNAPFRRKWFYLYYNFSENAW